MHSENKITQMQITAKALEAINKKGIRSKLALALNCTEGTIIRNIVINHSNLTKAAAIAVIKKETGLKDKDILEESEVSRTKVA